jgi:hypothetical protein
MAGNTKTFTIVDIEKTEAAFAALGGPQVDFSKSTGEAIDAHDHIKLSWVLTVGAPSTVAITVEDKPWYVEYGEIFNKIAQFFAA